MREVAETRDDIVRRLQFEKERLARYECAKLCTRSRPPEIHLVDRRLDRTEVGEPVVVGVRDEAAHRSNNTLSERTSLAALQSANGEARTSSGRLLSICKEY